MLNPTAAGSWEVPCCRAWGLDSDVDSLLSFFLRLSSSLFLSLSESNDENLDELGSEIMKFVRLNLIVSVLVNFPEGRVDVLISEWHMDVVSLKEAFKEKAKLFSVQMIITVTVELFEVLLKCFCQLSIFLVKFNKLL